MSMFVQIAFILCLWCGGLVTNAQDNATTGASTSAITTPGPTTSITQGTETTDGDVWFGLIVGFVILAIFVVIVCVMVFLVWSGLRQMWRGRLRWRRTGIQESLNNADYPYDENDDSEIPEIRAAKEYAPSTVPPKRVSGISTPRTDDEDDDSESADYLPAAADSHGPTPPCPPPRPRSIFRRVREHSVGIVSGISIPRTGVITIEGGVVKLDEFILTIGAGCLAEDTEITLKNGEQYFDFTSLKDLVFDTPRVVEFLPNGLKFLKPAELTIRHMVELLDLELFVLHGYHSDIYDKVVWELVSSGISGINEKKRGTINVEIYGFCFFSYILARRGKLARILSHLNHSFTCCAYVLHRRRPADTMDIVVVIVSEFVDDGEEGDIKQLKDHIGEGYERGQKGRFTRVHTNRRFVMSLVILGVETNPYRFKIDRSQLDSIGFSVNHFRGIASEQRENKTVKISEACEGGECLWELDVHGAVQIAPEDVYGQPEPSGCQPQGVQRTTKLTDEEVGKMRREVGIDWDGLGGLMDIPYDEREEIKLNVANYPKFSSRAGQILKHLNKSEDFCRHAVRKCLEELGRHDVKDKMLPLDDETEGGSAEITSSQPKDPEADELQNTPLSPREMFRLSQRIAVHWDRLASLMGIKSAERDEIRYNYFVYQDNCAKAEKILSIFNRGENFSRKTLADFLDEIGQDEWVEPILTGKWRIL